MGKEKQRPAFGYKQSGKKNCNNMKVMRVIGDCSNLYSKSGKTHCHNLSRRALKELTDGAMTTSVGRRILVFTTLN